MKKLISSLLNKKGETNSNLVYAAGFTIIAVVALVGLISMNSGSQADENTQEQTAGAANATPSVSISSVTLNSISLTETTGSSDCGVDTCATLVEGSTTIPVVIAGSASDDNGYQDIADADGTSGSWTAKLYRSDLNATCTATDITNGNCVDFTEADSNLTGGSGTSINFSFSSTVPFYMTPTDPNAPTNSALSWVAYVSAEDIDSATASGSDTFGFEVNTLVGISVSGTTSYTTSGGNLTLGGTSDDATIVVTNGGNRDIDFNIKGNGSTWSCVDNSTGASSGSFAIGQLKYSTSASQAWADMTAVTTSNAAVDANLTKGPNSTTNVYGKLKLPANGVGGTCTATLTFTGIAGS